MLRLSAVPPTLQKATEALQERTALSLCLPDISHPTSLQGQVAFLVADQSRHSQHTPVQMGNAGFHAVLWQMHNLRRTLGWLWGHSLHSKGQVTLSKRLCPPGRQEEPQTQRLRWAEEMQTRLHPHPAPSLPSTRDPCPQQVPFSSGPEVPGHRAGPRDADSHQKRDEGCGSGMRLAPQPKLAPSVALSSCHQETPVDLIS